MKAGHPVPHLTMRGACRYLRCCNGRMCARRTDGKDGTESGESQQPRCVSSLSFAKPIPPYFGEQLHDPHIGHLLRHFQLNWYVAMCTYRTSLSPQGRLTIPRSSRVLGNSTHLTICPRKETKIFRCLLGGISKQVLPQAVPYS